MRILFITRKFPPTVGGMQLFAYDLSQVLSAKTNLVLIKGEGSKLLTLLMVLPYLWFRAVFELIKGDIDIIHVQDGVQAPIGFILSRIFRKPYTVVIHGLDITYGNRIFQAIVPWSVRHADIVFCISQEVVSEVISRGVESSKVFFIPLAIKDDIYDEKMHETAKTQLNLPNDSRILLSVGRLVKRKGIAWFIDKVLPDLIVKYPSLILIVVGEGDERHNIEATIVNRNLAGSVKLLGLISDKDRKAAYNAADIFVMPNIPVKKDMEGFGLVLLEASVCALPVIASNIEGIKDAVADGKNGILVSTCDVEAFSNEIERFLSDRNYAKQFGEQSRKYTLENYKWSKVADRYLELYKQLIKK